MTLCAEEGRLDTYHSKKDTEDESTVDLSVNYPLQCTVPKSRSFARSRYVARVVWEEEEEEKEHFLRQILSWINCENRIFNWFKSSFKLRLKENVDVRIYLERRFQWIGSISICFSF